VIGVAIGGTILLSACLASAEEFSVLVDELAHEMLHRDPANRLKEKTVREAEAEVVAYVVCEGIGLDANTVSSDYIRLYDGDKKTLIRSLERIRRTAGEGEDHMGIAYDPKREAVAAWDAAKPTESPAVNARSVLRTVPYLCSRVQMNDLRPCRLCLHLP